MDAKLTKIQTSPAKHGNDRELANHENAQLTLDVSFESSEQRADIISILDMLKGDVQLTPKKTPYTLGKNLTHVFDPEDELEELLAQGKLRSVS